MAFSTITDGSEKFLARDLDDRLTFVDDMFAPDVVQAQNSEEEQQVRAEFSLVKPDAHLSSKSFPI
ncbi:MAG TPA: hypothetical protein V6C89_19035 [Drouetiella sp.]